ncbi:MAG TPA: pilus assembly protein TadG-related protein, partial [Acidobacteriaceae bacterium]|nr:pilus assembly protein TadG-related protein [Acidobacteriaceae bacterium]
MHPQSRVLEREEGQSVVLVVLAMGIFLIGAVGLGFDGSHLYSERMRAQLAADAAAQAAMMSVFDGTYNAGAAQFPVSSGGNYVCGSTLATASTPCVYADKNGFNSSNGDTITLSYPASSAAPGVQLASGYPTELIQVEVDRDVPTTLMRMLGPSATTVKAIGIAAIVSVNSPIPIIVIHPNLTQSFYVNGQPTVKICGGPQRSIQVNSTDANAFKI